MKKKNKTFVIIGSALAAVVVVLGSFVFVRHLKNTDDVENIMPTETIVQEVEETEPEKTPIVTIMGQSDGTVTGLTEDGEVATQLDSEYVPQSTNDVDHWMDELILDANVENNVGVDEEVEETEPVETEPVETEPVETEPVPTQPVEDDSNQSQEYDETERLLDELYGDSYSEAGANTVHGEGSMGDGINRDVQWN